MVNLAGKPITTNGLGLMRLTWVSDPLTPDDIAFKILKTALECGANVWNGADLYGTPEANSLHLLSRYFAKYPEDADKVVLCIKTGIVSHKPFKMDGSPEFLRERLEVFNKILDGNKFIDIYGCGRVDPNVPIETTVRGLAELVQEGKIGGIALSEVSADTIRRASKVHQIAMVEAEVSLWATDIFTNGVAETCAELGIVVEGHTPLGAGMLTGKIKTIEDMGNDGHKLLPRWQGENFRKNLDLVAEVEKLAEKKGCTPAQLALSWIRSHNGKPGMPFILPIAGARAEERVLENCTHIELTDEDLKAIDDILQSFPVAGPRNSEALAKLAEY